MSYQPDTYPRWLGSDEPEVDLDELIAEKQRDIAVIDTQLEMFRSEGWALAAEDFITRAYAERDSLLSEGNNIDKHRGAFAAFQYVLARPARLEQRRAQLFQEIQELQDAE